MIAAPRLRVLVACEYSGRVRDAFAARDHDAWSCDLLASETPGNHIQDDVLAHLADGWDLMIAHPPCTYLSRAGANLWKQRERQAVDACVFARTLYDAPISKVAIENPIGRLSVLWRPPISGFIRGPSAIRTPSLPICGYATSPRCSRGLSYSRTPPLGA